VEYVNLAKDEDKLRVSVNRLASFVCPNDGTFGVS
jgi:hypothetical protein